MAMFLTFERDRCKGCELCVSVCPKHIWHWTAVPTQKGIGRDVHRPGQLYRLCQLCADLSGFHHHD